MCVCVFIAGLVTSCQTLKLSSVLGTVINLAGTVARGHARIHFSPHTRAFPQAFAEKKKKTGRVVRFSSPA